VQAQEGHAPQLFHAQGDSSVMAMELSNNVPLVGMVRMRISNAVEQVDLNVRKGNLANLVWLGISVLKEAYLILQSRAGSKPARLALRVNFTVLLQQINV
jgi:hypothetical protein